VQLQVKPLSTASVPSLELDATKSAVSFRQRT
jgi:hypothetical protein